MEILRAEVATCGDERNRTATLTDPRFKTEDARRTLKRDDVY